VRVVKARRENKAIRRIDIGATTVRGDLSGSERSFAVNLETALLYAEKQFSVLGSVLRKKPTADVHGLCGSGTNARSFGFASG
jgi:hypothetical protein